MKHILLLTLVSTTLAFTNEPKEPITPIETKIETKSAFSDYLTKAVNSVENARKDAVDALNTMVSKVDSAREKNPTVHTSISTQIVETKSLAEIARNTADVEIAKAHAMAAISKAVDALDAATPENKPKIEASSYATIVKAITSVEIAKAHASKNIAQSTGRVEISKTMPKDVPHAQETLSIAKNLSAVEIAKSVSDVEVAKSNSYIEIAKSSMGRMMPSLSIENKAELEDMKAKATAKISSYLTKLEVMKAEIEAKIAKEVAKVEIAESLTK